MEPGAKKSKLEDPKCEERSVVVCGGDHPPSNIMDYSVCVLKEGYSKMEKGKLIANSTCTLIKGNSNIIVDTLSPWDKDFLLEALKQQGLSCNDIQYVVCTHGHVDHVGNLNLFTKATQIVGYSVCQGDQYYIHPFEMNMPYVIDDRVEVIPTPGHTGTDVSVLVRTDDRGVIAIVGDLFEREEDMTRTELWKDIAGSEHPKLQERNRNKILRRAHFIIPGHGPMFEVKDEMKPQSPVEVEGEEEPSPFVEQMP